MIWYDTDNTQLKKRNEANSDWITLGTIDEGTGTFTPSGERALASQAEAEAGTDNTTLMTPLRTAEAIAALAPAPTSAQVGTATAGLAYGAVGSYIFGAIVGNGTLLITEDTNYAGSSINPGGVFSNQTGADIVSSEGASLRGATTLSGTWRSMGRARSTATSIRTFTTLFLRIS
jgi:hypothetical protein